MKSVLGIDIGTSSIAVVVLNETKELLHARSLEHGADLPSPPDCDEQDSAVLVSVAEELICGIPIEIRKSVSAVGVTGQMHGVVMLDNNLKSLSPLITWQDKRCKRDGFIQSLRENTGYFQHSGYGNSTLAWFVSHQKLPRRLQSAATIHDYYVALLTGSCRPVTDPTDAASWGLFDLVSWEWDVEAIERAGIPLELLPRIRPSSSRAGFLCTRMAQNLGLPQGIPVAMAIGDQQASLLSTLKEPEIELGLTLGTGGQLAAVLPTGFQADSLPESDTFDLRPYPESRFVLVGAVLCGGSAWFWLIETIENWLKDLGVVAPPRAEIYRRLNDLGSAAGDNLRFGPHFSGERYDPDLSGSITGIDLNNFDLGSVSRALARGIFVNLKTMMPESVLSERKRIRGSGNALRFNPLLQDLTEQVFGLPLSMSEFGEEAACGAAINATGIE